MWKNGTNYTEAVRLAVVPDPEIQTTNGAQAGKMRETGQEADRAVSIVTEPTVDKAVLIEIREQAVSNGIPGEAVSKEIDLLHAIIVVAETPALGAGREVQDEGAGKVVWIGQVADRVVWRGQGADSVAWRGQVAWRDGDLPVPMGEVGGESELLPQGHDSIRVHM